MPQLTEEQSTLEGTVSSIIFQNEENGYTILRLDAGEEEMTVVGSMPGVSLGSTHRPGQGAHATYGTQFRADVVECRLPQGLKEIFHYLASGAIKGIGKATARQLIETFGEDALRVIEEEPEKLTTLKGSPPSGPGPSATPSGNRWGCAACWSSWRSISFPRSCPAPVPGLWGRGPEVVWANPTSWRGVWGELPRRTPWPLSWASPRTTPAAGGRAL